MDDAQSGVGPLHWEMLGRHGGPPLLLVHPNPMDFSCWLFQMAHFSTWYRVVAVDLPGYGRSPAHRSGLTNDTMAAACWAALDEVVGREPSIIAGVSVGATLVRTMAVQRPEQTRAIIMSGTGYYPNGIPAAETRVAAYTEQGIAARGAHAFNGFSPAFRETPEARYYVEMFTERNKLADAETIAEIFRSIGQPEPDGVLAGILAPTLIITGSEDQAHPAAFELQRRIANCELRTIEGAGHDCHLERPREWDAHALEFLARRGLLPPVER